MEEKNQICADCGSRQPPVLKNRGYGWIEILCWVALVLPGIIYSVWRRARRRWVCAYCGNPSMVSVYSARARTIMSLMQAKEVPKERFKNEMGVTDLKPPKRRPKKPAMKPRPKPR